MQKKIVISVCIINLLFMLACSFGYEGISIGDEQEPVNPFQEMMLEATTEAVAEAESAAPTAKAEYQAVVPSGSNAEQAAAGTHEYSITASNFDCTCQATDNMTVDIQFTGNQVEITNGGGGASQVYDKIGESQYKKTEMGYYILVEGSGDQATETKVEEENHTVITFTSDGYVMESFKGSASSPCCYYTFKIEK